MEKKQMAWNRNLWLPLFLFPVFIYLAISCAQSEEWAMFACFLFFALLAGLVIFIQPLVITFSKDEIDIIYTIGVKETVAIRQIREIYEEGNWFGGYKGWPVYVIRYPRTRKRAFFISGEIPKTRKIKKLVDKYCGEKLI